MINDRTFKVRNDRIFIDIFVLRNDKYDIYIDMSYMTYNYIYI